MKLRLSVCRLAQGQRVGRKQGGYVCGFNFGMLSSRSAVDARHIVCLMGYGDCYDSFSLFATRASPDVRSKLKLFKRVQKLLLISSFALLILSRGSSAQKLGGPITINSTNNGDTIGASRGGFSDFKSKDAGGGGKTLYTFVLPADESISVWEMQLSTCRGASFDTYIAVFEGTVPSKESMVAEANDDPNCVGDEGSSTEGKRSTTSVYMSSGNTYSVLITGVGLAEGTFTLSLDAKLPRQNTVVPWNLDRVDQRKLPLDSAYTVPNQGPNGDGARVYVLDSGVNGDHDEFSGRMLPGFDFLKLTEVAEDFTGFGTHAAAVIAGASTGVARSVKIVPVRILDERNQAKSKYVVDALEWIVVKLQEEQSARRTPSVVYMRYHAKTNKLVDEAVRAVSGFGVPVIAPAGDGASGSYCNSTSPATSGAAIMVSSTGISDRRSATANYGSCTDLFAPGENVTGASYTSDSAFTFGSGSALAAAHVAGAVALLMSMNIDVDIKPKDMRTILRSLGTPNVVKNGTGDEGLSDETSDSAGSSSRLLYVRSIPSLFGDRKVGEIPEAKKVYIYFILAFEKVTATQTDTCGAIPLKEGITEILDLKENDVTSFCSADGAVYRILASERGAAATSSNIRNAFGTEKEDTQKTLGTNFKVVEEPWFVDSLGLTYWSQPRFGKTDSEGITIGAIIGIAGGVLVLLSILLAGGCVIYRHFWGVDDIESMEGSADFERAPAQFNDFGKKDGPHEGNLVVRSFRNVFDGIKGSMRGSSSMSRSSSRRGVGGNKAGGGISRMDSFMGEVRGGEQGGGTDIMRMKSYGGEAFAGLGALNRSNSIRASDASGSAGSLGVQGGAGNSERIASFPGMGQLMGLSGNGQESTGLERMDSSASNSAAIRMHSVGGEAFASMLKGGIGGGAPSVNSKQVSSQTENSDDNNRLSTVDAEALATEPEESGREPSYFGHG